MARLVAFHGSADVIGEVIHFDTAVSANTREFIELSLMQKWKTDKQ